MSQKDDALWAIIVRALSWVGSTAFHYWTIYHALPLMWGWSVVAMGGPAITGMQAIVLRSMVSVIHPVKNEWKDDDGKPLDQSVVRWMMPVAVWMVVGALKLLAWIIGADL